MVHFFKHRSLSLSLKLYSVLIPLAATSVIASWLTWRSLQTNASDLIAAWQVKELATRSLALLLTQDDATKVMLLDPENSRAGARKIQAYDANTAVMQEIEKLSNSPDIRKTLAELRTLDEKELRLIDTTLLETLGDGKAARAKSVYFSQYEPARARYEAGVRRLGEQAEAAARAAAGEMDARNLRSLRTICGSIALGMLAVACILIAVTRSTQAALERAIERLKQGASAAAKSSSNLTKASTAISDAVSQTANSAQETNAALTSIAGMSHQNNIEADHANQLTSETVDAMTEALTATRQMTSAMETIRSSTDSISKVIHSIDEIAFQTKILALNAAMEAARAGQAGLGFSVVAEAVRTLADRSAEAASESTDLIQNAMDKTREGAFLARSVESNIEGITTKVSGIGGVIGRIAEASRDQKLNIDGVKSAMQQIESATQTNATQVGEGSSTALALETQAGMLSATTDELFRLVTGCELS